jgi:GT2 family glycosyltransferase
MRTVKRPSIQGSTKQKLRTAFSWVGERRFSGYAVDPASLDQRFTIEITVDGYVVRVVRADAYVHELAQQSLGDGFYGFSVSLDARVVNGGAVAAARLANLGTAVGPVITLDRPSPSTDSMDGPGSVRWLGGLRFSGWVSADQNPASMNVLVDGILIDRIRISRWSHIGGGDAARAVRSFDVFLPARFGDGGVHQFAIVTANGENLNGCPHTFLAFADGLRDFVATHDDLGQESVRPELFDQLVPAAVPFAQYREWQRRFPIVGGPPATQSCGVVMVGPGEMDDTLTSLEQQSDANWIAAALPADQNPMGFQPDLVRDFLEVDCVDCAYVLFGLAGTRLTQHALRRIGHVFSVFNGACAVYGDLDIRSDDGSIWPLALSAFDYERMLEQGYCAHLFALRSVVAKQALAAGASDLYRLFNSIFEGESVSSDGVVHLPGSLGVLAAFDRQAASETLAAASLAHLQARGIDAKAAATSAGIFPAVRIARVIEPPSVTIVIPTRDRQALLEACIESIRPALKRGRIEILVVDNDSAEPNAREYLAKIGSRLATVVRVPGTFNFARLNNHAAAAANTDMLCLLNNDVKALDDSWLEEMLSRIGEPDVGAVGATLLWPSGVVQHGGVVLGIGFAADHAFKDRMDGDPGYGDLLRVAHECSAVTAACLITRRQDYLGVDGMDEVLFPVNFNDVDYCLKLRARGQRIVFTPHAKLLHLESASRGLDLALDRKARLDRELRNLRSKWGSVLAADPYYSPLLSRDPIPYSALAWPPGSAAPRVNLAPLAADVPPGF